VSAVCHRCGRPLEATVYEVRAGSDWLPCCLRCALIHPPLVVRSLLIAAVVGTLLTFVVSAFALLPVTLMGATVGIVLAPSNSVLARSVGGFIEFFLPGCPPPADRIKAFLTQVLAGESPKLKGPQLKFG